MSFLQMSLTGAVMILAIIVIRAVAINRVPKRTFLVLWGAALLRLLVPFSLPSCISIYSLLRHRAAPAAANVFPTVLPVIPSGQAASAVPQTGTAIAPTVSAWSTAWLVGLMLCALVFAVAYRKCYQEFQMSLPVKNEFARQWLQAHPLRRMISIRQSDRISSPLTFGILHPVILLPKKTDWKNEALLQYVLEHEFVHIKRFDAAAKLLLAAAVCMHWFNPLVWVMYALANRDIELSCDEAVVLHFGSSTRAAYAKALICMEETRSGFAPLCNHFSKNAIEERITAIMKTKKTTLASFSAAAVLVVGTVTLFATSAKAETGIGRISASVPSAAETDDAAEPSAEYLAAGITRKNNLWYYQGKSVAGLYDDNGDIYTYRAAADDLYLHITRDSQGHIGDVDIIPQKQFRELVDKHMNLNPAESVIEEDSLMSYIDPSDGKTYYSFDGGKTFTPLTDAELEALYPTQDIEWWTYDEYKAWLEQEKVNLQSCIGEKGWTSGQGEFIWTQKMVDETIAMYESILEEIKNGTLYSKTVDGQDDMVISYNPADIEMGTAGSTKDRHMSAAWNEFE